jgi:hypothetical protein
MALPLPAWLAQNLPIGKMQNCLADALVMYKQNTI